MRPYYLLIHVRESNSIKRVISILDGLEEKLGMPRSLLSRPCAESGGLIFEALEKFVPEQLDQICDPLFRGARGGAGKIAQIAVERGSI